MEAFRAPAPPASPTTAWLDAAALEAFRARFGRNPLGEAPPARESLTLTLRELTGQIGAIDWPPGVADVARVLGLHTADPDALVDLHVSGFRAGTCAVCKLPGSPLRARLAVDTEGDALEPMPDGLRVGVERFFCGAECARAVGAAPVP